MIKKPVLKRFLKQLIAPEFDRFYLHHDDMLIRTSSIFVHGIYFQRSGVVDDIYVQPFVDFLVDGGDFIGFTINQRVGRIDMLPDNYQSFFALDPPEEAANIIVKSIRANELYPLVMHPTCRLLLDAFDWELDGVWQLFGMGCCAIMEGESERADRLLAQFDHIMTQFDDNDAKRAHELYLTLKKRLNNLDSCRDFLWKRCEETIRLRKLEKIAALSGWKPG